jgi:hydrogenase maturation factor
VAVGQYVLLDRGMIIEVIDADQVEEMLQFYTELTEMWEKEDALHV